jgi:hypothetical protein
LPMFVFPRKMPFPLGRSLRVAHTRCKPLLDMD